MFTDASDIGWAVIITQVLEWDDSLRITEQQHELLHCISGTFSGAEINWSIIENEAFPIIEACTKLTYLYYVIMVFIYTVTTETLYIFFHLMKLRRNI